MQKYISFDRIKTHFSLYNIIETTLKQELRLDLFTTSIRKIYNFVTSFKFQLTHTRRLNKLI